MWEQIYRDGLPDHVPVPPQIRNRYHATMKLKYEWAARFPWLPVSSDPPVPW